MNAYDAEKNSAIILDDVTLKKSETEISKIFDRELWAVPDVKFSRRPEKFGHPRSLIVAARIAAMVENRYTAKHSFFWDIRDANDPKRRNFARRMLESVIKCAGAALIISGLDSLKVNVEANVIDTGKGVYDSGRSPIDWSIFLGVLSSYLKEIPYNVRPLVIFATDTKIDPLVWGLIDKYFDVDENLRAFNELDKECFNSPLAARQRAAHIAKRLFEVINENDDRHTADDPSSEVFQGEMDRLFAALENCGRSISKQDNDKILAEFEAYRQIVQGKTVH